MRFSTSANKKPRVGLFAEKPGSYSPTVRLRTPVINAGEEVHFQIFFSGYGDIRTAKIYCNPSDEIFEPKNSRLITDFRLENNVMFWGKNSVGIANNGTMIELSGGYNPGTWDSSTQFFDVNDSKCPTLSTEIVTKYKDEEFRAPLTFELKTLKKIKTGKYTIELVFTYYNGEKWSSQTKQVEFKVQNFLERYAVTIGTLALTGSSIGVLIGLQRLIQLIVDWYYQGYLFEIK